MSNAVANVSALRSVDAADEEVLNDEQMWHVVSTGDLKGLTAKQRTAFYQFKCRELGISPAHQPFQFITFQGKEILYGTKNLAEQLRGLHGVTFHGITFSDEGELMTYEGFVRTRDGREDYEIGVLAVAGLKGDARANAKMKCLTKFKRRATLSICGAGVPDETEIEAGDRLERRTYPQQVVSIVPEAPALTPNAALQDRDRDVIDGEIVDADTGEITGQQALPNDIPENGTDMIDKQQRGRILFLAGKLNWEMDAVNGFAGEMTGISNIDLLSKQRAAYVIQEMEGQIPGKQRP